LTAGSSAVGDREYRRSPATAPPAVHVQRWWGRVRKRVVEAPERQISGTPGGPTTGSTDAEPSLQAIRLTSEPVNASLETAVCSRDTPQPDSRFTRNSGVSLPREPRTPTEHSDAPVPPRPHATTPPRYHTTTLPHHHATTPPHQHTTTLPRHHTSNSNPTDPHACFPTRAPTSAPNPCPSSAPLIHLTETMTSIPSSAPLPAQDPPLTSNRLSRATNVSSLSSLSILSSLSDTKATETKIRDELARF
jgi:hypothetical protein